MSAIEHARLGVGVGVRGVDGKVNKLPEGCNCAIARIWRGEWQTTHCGRGGV